MTPDWEAHVGPGFKHLAGWAVDIDSQAALSWP
jgi:hypothetical protein